MTAFRSREEALAARNQELEHLLAAEKARADAAERGLGAAQRFEAVTDVHLGLARGLLWATVVGYAIGAVVSFPAYITIATIDSGDLPFRGLPPVLVGVGMALLVSGFFLPIGIGALLGAVGLRRGQRWGYNAAVFTFCVLCLFCAPVGMYGLWAFLRERVKNVYYPPIAPVQPVQPVQPHAGAGPAAWGPPRG